MVYVSYSPHLTNALYSLKDRLWIGQPFAHAINNTVEAYCLTVEEKEAIVKELDKQEGEAHN